MIRTTAALLLLSACALAQPPARGSIATYPQGKEPACDEAHRGSVIVTLGNPGQADLVKACIRTGTGRFIWNLVSQQNTNSFVHSPKIGGCPIFPDNNVWNSRVDALPVHAESKAIINTYAQTLLGTVPSMWLNLADASTPGFPVAFSSPESDGGLYPITPQMILEGFAFNKNFDVAHGPYGGDAHLLVLKTDECKLYEIFALQNTAPPYSAGSGAIYDLSANNLRPDGWTSADAAGLPIWPGILSYRELYEGNEEIQHMLRFTVNKTRNGYIWPARHLASRNADVAVPPMGSRWRLRASFDETTCRARENSGKPFPPEIQRLIRALKHYGMIVSDNGLPIKLTTDSDPRWGDPGSETSPTWIIQGWCHCMAGKDFEVVDASSLMAAGNDSAAVVQ